MLAQPWFLGARALCAFPRLYFSVLLKPFNAKRLDSFLLLKPFNAKLATCADPTAAPIVPR